MPHADYNQCEQHDSAVLAEDVEKNLEDWLPSAGIDSLVKVLDGEQKTEKQEEAEDRTADD